MLFADVIKNYIMISRRHYRMHERIDRARTRQPNGERAVITEGQFILAPARARSLDQVSSPSWQLTTISQFSKLHVVTRRAPSSSPNRVISSNSTSTLTRTSHRGTTCTVTSWGTNTVRHIIVTYARDVAEKEKIQTFFRKCLASMRGSWGPRGSRPHVSLRRPGPHRASLVRARFSASGIESILRRVGPLAFLGSWI